jgi:hypothetical protein
VSTDLVSLAQAQDHLKDSYSENENDIALKIKAASKAIIKYLDGGEDAFTDSDGQLAYDSNGEPLGVPEDIQIACLLLLGEFYRNRDGEQGGAIDAQFGYGYLPRPVVALLFPYRSPVLG